MLLEYELRVKEAAQSSNSGLRSRNSIDKLREKYTWSSPPSRKTMNDLKKAVGDMPIIETGAGTGYWAYEMRRHELNVIEVSDIVKPTEGGRWANTLWVDDMLQIGHIDHLQRHDLSQVAWFTCWAHFNPSIDNQITEALMYHLNSKGDTIICVGEGIGGATHGEAFWSMLYDHYECSDRIRLDHCRIDFGYLDDHVSVWRR